MLLSVSLRNHHRIASRDAFLQTPRTIPISRRDFYPQSLSRRRYASTEDSNKTSESLCHNHRKEAAILLCPIVRIPRRTRWQRFVSRVSRSRLVGCPFPRSNRTRNDSIDRIKRGSRSDSHDYCSIRRFLSSFCRSSICVGNAVDRNCLYRWHCPHLGILLEHRLCRRCEPTMCYFLHGPVLWKDPCHFASLHGVFESDKIRTYRLYKIQKVTQESLLAYVYRDHTRTSFHCPHKKCTPCEPMVTKESVKLLASHTLYK